MKDSKALVDIIGLEEDFLGDSSVLAVYIVWQMVLLYPHGLCECIGWQSKGNTALSSQKR